MNLGRAAAALITLSLLGSPPLTWSNAYGWIERQMKFRTIARLRVATLVVGVALLSALVLPCLCAEERGRGAEHAGHCGATDEGVRVTAASPCCCGVTLPSSTLVTAKVIPTSPGTTSSFAMLFPARFLTLLAAATSPGRPSHGPPAPVVLRI